MPLRHLAGRAVGGLHSSQHKNFTVSIDYDPRTEATQRFFKTVQNKMHFSAHGHTAAEVIFQRADADKDFMGLTTWRGAMPTKHEAEIAKNYLTEEEVDMLNRIVTLYLDFAELQAKNFLLTPEQYRQRWRSSKQTLNMTASANAHNISFRLLKFTFSKHSRPSRRNSKANDYSSRR